MAPNKPCLLEFVHWGGILPHWARIGLCEQNRAEVIMCHLKIKLQRFWFRSWVPVSSGSLSCASALSLSSLSLSLSLSLTRTHTYTHSGRTQPHDGSSPVLKPTWWETEVSSQHSSKWFWKWMLLPPGKPLMIIPPGDVSVSTSCESLSQNYPQKPLDVGHKKCLLFCASKFWNNVLCSNRDLIQLVTVKINL